MRTREEIEQKAEHYIEADSEFTATDAQLLLEVLLDIRELLQNPPIEISGTPLQTNHPDHE